jgi:heterodisulfide reductase subunit B
MKYAFFPGCKVPYHVPYYETSARLVLKEFGIELEAPEFNCCGYPIRFLDFKAFLFSSARNLALAGRSGLPLLCLCKCCYGTLRYADQLLRNNESLLAEINHRLGEEGLHYPNRPVIKHLLNVLFEVIDPETIEKKIARPLKKVKTAAHYGCHILRPHDVVDFDDPVNPSKFEKLIAYTGAESVDWVLRKQCCGDPLWEKNKELSLELANKKITDARQAGAKLLCVGCTHCLMQFERVQAKEMSGTEKDLQLPPLLYPQLLGFSLGLDGDDLGISLGLIERLSE